MFAADREETETDGTAFRVFRVRVDQWEVNYGDQTPLAALDDRPDEQVDHEVEMSDDEWSAIIPADSVTVPERVVFVDGIRRLEARVHAPQGEQLIHGGFGSHAVGAVAATTLLIARGCSAVRVP